MTCLAGSLERVQVNKVYFREQNSASGYLEFQDARVKWFLSTDSKHLPDHIKKINQTTFRAITIDDNELEFSGGFSDLHNFVYKDIIEGKGYGLADARTSIEIVEKIRTSQISKKKKTIITHCFYKNDLESYVK